MLPRWHIFYGAIFSALVWRLFPNIAWYNLALIFFASVFIDFDHYICAVWKTRKWSLFNAFEYYNKLIKKYRIEHKKGIRKKEDFNIFHTVEFHIFILIMGLIFEPFLYILMGMALHSLLDLVYMTWHGVMYRREFFLTNWIIRTKVLNP